jgi:hypothetical protein
MIRETGDVPQQCALEIQSRPEPPWSRGAKIPGCINGQKVVATVDTLSAPLMFFQRIPRLMLTPVIG